MKLQMIAAYSFNFQLFVYAISKTGHISVADPIPEPNFFHPGSKFFPSRIRIKEFKYFKPKNWFQSSRKYDPGCSSRIRILTFSPSRIPDPGVKKAPDPGSATLGHICTCYFFTVVDGLNHRVPTPTPPSTRGKTGRNHLNEEITPLLPTGIGEPYQILDM
jgi:hypothetical protein